MKCCKSRMTLLYTSKFGEANYRYTAQGQHDQLKPTQLVVSETLAGRWSRKRSFNLNRHGRRHAGRNHGHVKHYAEHGADALSDFYRRHPAQGVSGYE